MKRVLRVKAVSNAIGIRRSIVSYQPCETGVYVLDKAEYPLKNLKYELKVNLNEVNLIFNKEEIKLEDGISHSFKTIRKVKTLTGEELEALEYNFMVVPLNEEAITYYEESIKKGYVFDEKNGEFNYLIGLAYQSLGNEQLAKTYLQKAKEEGFN